MATKLEGENLESLQILLDADTSAPLRARREVETLGNRLSPHTIANLRAVVTELVAIYLSPSDSGQIEIHIEIEEGNVRCEIRHRDEATAEISGAGHALRIIGALVDKWSFTTEQAVAWLRLPATD